ncbi:MAG TPA: class I SAM-dependent methyltransferase, partial [Methanocella sp.]|nr:class I SAM-dependent methyltransferase [Methanocella sp.]
MATHEVTFKEPNRILAAFQAFTYSIMARTYYRLYVESLGFRGGERVLEYGSGPGAMSKVLAGALPHGHLTCVDISEVWMGYMRKVARQYANIDLMQGDIADLGIPPESYDVVFIHFVIHDVPGNVRREKMKIVLDKLKKGGQVFIREPTSAGHGIAPGEIRAIMTENGLRETSSVTGRRPHGPPTF